MTGRPRRLVLVAGTATDIGKTWVGAEVLARLRAHGVTVAARKPAQSAAPDDPGPSDAEVLAGATGEAPDKVCPSHRSYRIAMAPPMAAAALGMPAVRLGDLLTELVWPDPPVDIGWLETVGGPRSPIAEEADAVTLVEVLAPDTVLLVADAGLGTINAVLSSLAAFRRGVRPVGVRTADIEVVVYLNRYDNDVDLHRRNRHWLDTREGLEVIVDLEALTDRLRP